MEELTRKIKSVIIDGEYHEWQPLQFLSVASLDDPFGFYAFQLRS